MSADNPNYKTVLVSDLIPYARNSRTHSDVQINKIASSIKEFGFLNPVLIDKDNGIIAGHGRVMAAQKLGLKEVPVLQIGHLSDTQKRAYIIADNRLALDAGWDEEMLRVEFAGDEVDLNRNLTKRADDKAGNAPRVVGVNLCLDGPSCVRVRAEFCVELLCSFVVVFVYLARALLDGCTECRGWRL